MLDLSTQIQICGLSFLSVDGNIAGRDSKSLLSSGASLAEESPCSVLLAKRDNHHRRSTVLQHRV